MDVKQQNFDVSQTDTEVIYTVSNTLKIFTKLQHTTFHWYTSL